SAAGRCQPARTVEAASPSGTASTALSANSTAYLPSSAKPEPSTAASELPTNSDPAKKETTVALAEGSTSVAQVCSEECMDDHARPSRIAASAATATAWEKARSVQAPQADTAPSPI